MIGDLWQRHSTGDNNARRAAMALIWRFPLQGKAWLHAAKWSIKAALGQRHR